MRLRDRFRLAAKVLRAGSDQNMREVAHGMLAGIVRGPRGEPPKRDVPELVKAYGTHPLLRANIGKIATSFASTRWRLYAVKGKAGKYVRDRVLQTAALRERRELLAKAQTDKNLVELPSSHPFLTMYSRPIRMFYPGVTSRKMTEVYRLIAGESVEIIDRAAPINPRTGRGTPVMMWGVPPHWLISTPTPSNPLYQFSFMAWQRDIPPEDVQYALKDPDPSNPYARGSGIGRALADELDAFENSISLQNYAFHNRGRPDTLISMEGADADDVASLEDEFTASQVGLPGYKRTWFTNAKLTATPLAQDFKELDVLNLSRYTSDVVRMVTGMPPEILGIVESSNRATAEAADHHYTTHVLVPELEFEREYRQEFLVPEFDERLVLDYVSPVQEDREFQRSIMSASPVSFFVDEFRERAGYPPLPDGAGQVHMKPFGVQGVESLLPEETVQQGLNGAQISAASTIVAQVAAGEIPRDAGLGMLETLFNLTPEQAARIMGSAGTGEPTTPNPIEGDDKGDGNGDGGGPVPPPPQAPPVPPPADGAEVPAKARVLVLRRKVLNTLSHWASLVEKLHLPGEDKFLRAYRSWERELRASQMKAIRGAEEGTDPKSLIFDLKDEQGRVWKKTKGVYRQIFDAAMEQASEDVESAGKRSRVQVVKADEFKRWMQIFQERIEITVDTMQSRFENVLANAAINGWDMDEVEARMEAEFDAYEDGGKMDAIALNETAGTISGGRDVVFDEAGVEASEWLTAGDERVREYHVEYGKVGPVERGFNYPEVVGESYTLRMPHDPECEELSDVIGCRCVLVPA